MNRKHKPHRNIVANQEEAMKQILLKSEQIKLTFLATDQDV